MMTLTCNNGTVGINTFPGTTGADIINDLAGNDSITADAGTNRIDSTASSGAIGVPANCIVSGAGYDAAVYAGSVSDCGITQTAGCMLTVVKLTEASQDTLTVTNLAALPNGISFDAAAQRFTVDPNAPAFDALTAGQTLILTIAWDVTDGSAFGPTQAQFTISGVDNYSLSGLAGVDKLYGLDGADTMDGGSVCVLSTADATGLAADSITDFTSGTDRVELAIVDGIRGGANDAFTWIDSAAFSAAGQLR